MSKDGSTLTLNRRNHSLGVACICDIDPLIHYCREPRVLCLPDTTTEEGRHFDDVAMICRPPRHD